MYSFQDSVALPPSSSVEPENKLVNRALELAQSLFGPDTTIVKTFQAIPIQRELDLDDDTARIARKYNISSAITRLLLMFLSVSFIRQKC